MVSLPAADILAFRLALSRRSFVFSHLHIALPFYKCLFRDDDRCRDSGPGGRYSGNSAVRVFVVISSLGSDLPVIEYSGEHPLDLVCYTSSILYRGRSRCFGSRRWLEGTLGSADRISDNRLNFLCYRLEQDAKNAGERMRGLLDRLLGLRWFALLAKEFRQIARNRRLVIILIIPPTVNIVLFGYALNPTVRDLRLGVVDESRSFESREMISAMVESGSFQIAGYYISAGEMGNDLGAAKLDIGLVIPSTFAKQRARRETAEIQLLVDAVNSNTATIAGGYASNIIAALNQRILQERTPQTGAPQAI